MTLEEIQLNIRNLITKSNEVTGEDATDLTSATKNLVDGFGGGTGESVLYARSDFGETKVKPYHNITEMKLDDEYFEYDSENYYFVAKKQFTAYIMFFISSTGYTYKGAGWIYQNGTSKASLNTSSGVQYRPVISVIQLNINVGDTIYYGQESGSGIGATAIGMSIYDATKLRDGTTKKLPVWSPPENWFRR